ncbi:MAG: GxxExxY protein [Planctomycetota bacterium]
MELESLTESIIGAAIEVHRRLGPGFLESIYEKALILELHKRGLSVVSQKELIIRYDRVEVGRQRLDLFVEDLVLVELKAVKKLEPVHFAVARSYLRALERRHGLLMNFNKPTLEVRRVLNPYDSAS